MKRTLGSLLVLVAVSFAAAQSSFTIVRPADGAKVRETVRLLFPLNSIPDGGYVGIYLGGKFVEAVVPGKGANYLFYDIDTKERAIPDGPLQVEAVLFQEFSDRPRILDRSSVNLTISNSANITIPDAGIKLHYNFKKGTQWVYRLNMRSATNNSSEAMAGQISTASLLAGAPVESFRLLYAIDDTYAGGDGLIRMQAMTEKGKTDLTVTPENSDAPKLYQDYQMHPIYMRVRPWGKEVFGSIPVYHPFEGTAGESFRTDLFADFPLPFLPQEPKKPGASWDTAFQLGNLDLDHRSDLKSVITPITPVRGEFVGVEWQNGHPCARLKTSLAVRAPSAAGGGGLANAQAIKEDIWFAMDLGTVIKMTRTYTIDVKMEAAPAGGSGSVAGNGPSRAGANGLPGDSGSSNGAARGADFTRPGGKTTNLNQQGRRGGAQGGGRRGDGPEAAGAGGQGGAPAMGGNTQRTGRTGGSTGTRILRKVVEMVFELEGK